MAENKTTKKEKDVKQPTTKKTVKKVETPILEEKGLVSAKSIAKTIRISPRKVRLVIDLIRGKNIKEAQAILMFTPKAASPVILKALNSAVANATHNYNADESKLFVKEIFANEGVRMKRMLPRAKGQGDTIQKRTSHITVVVSERE